MPPRPTGTKALLRGAPDADLLIVAHEGMEGFGGGAIVDIARNLPLRHPVRVRLWRIPRAAVPVDEHTLAGWLLEVWAEIDDWIERGQRERNAGAGLPAGLVGLPEVTW